MRKVVTNDKKGTSIQLAKQFISLCETHNEFMSIKSIIDQCLESKVATSLNSALFHTKVNALESKFEEQYSAANSIYEAASDLNLNTIASTKEVVTFMNCVANTASIMGELVVVLFDILHTVPYEAKLASNLRQVANAISRIEKLTSQYLIYIEKIKSESGRFGVGSSTLESKYSMPNSVVSKKFHDLKSYFDKGLEFNKLVAEKVTELAHAYYDSYGDRKSLNKAEERFGQYVIFLLDKNTANKRLFFTLPSAIWNTLEPYQAHEEWERLKSMYTKSHFSSSSTINRLFTFGKNDMDRIINKMQQEQRSIQKSDASQAFSVLHQYVRSFPRSESFSQENMTNAFQLAKEVMRFYTPLEEECINLESKKNSTRSKERAQAIRQCLSELKNATSTDSIKIAIHRLYAEYERTEKNIRMKWMHSYGLKWMKILSEQCAELQG